MNFDWQAFLDAQGIDYVVGPATNIRRGHVGFSCPGCPNDTGNHFSIEVESGKIRGCWRDPAHWLGPVELIATLAGVSWSRAREILDSGDVSTEATTARALLASLERPQERAPAKLALPTLPLPADFLRFRGEPSRLRRPFDDYLGERGFDDPERLSYDFGIRYALSGRWANRIVFPFWRDGRLVGWTGRAIGRAKARYIAEPTGDAMAAILWESRRVEEGDVLALVEGPFDALRIADVLDEDVVAAALLTNSAGPEKRARILALSARARRTVIILDEGAETRAIALQRDLAVIKPALVFCPSDPFLYLSRRDRDPGALSPQGVEYIFRGIL